MTLCMQSCNESVYGSCSSREDDNLRFFWSSTNSTLSACRTERIIDAFLRPCSTESRQTSALRAGELTLPRLRGFHLATTSHRESRTCRTSQTGHQRSSKSFLLASRTDLPGRARPRADADRTSSIGQAIRERDFCKVYRCEPSGRRD